MQIEIYCNLYISETLQDKKDKIVKKLKANKLQPSIYIITLSQGEQNHLEFFSSVLLKQHVFDHNELFVVGIANGYDEALFLVKTIAEDVYKETGTTEIRKELLAKQSQKKEYER